MSSWEVCAVGWDLGIQMFPDFLKCTFFWFKNYRAAAQDRIVCNYNHYVIQSSFKNLLITVGNFKQILFLAALCPCASFCICPDLVFFTRNVHWNGVKAFQIQQDTSLASCQVLLSGSLWTFSHCFPLLFCGFHQVEMMNNSHQIITWWCSLLTVPEVL